MKILVYGAGVLGSIYAAKLARGGHDVTILARGRRLEELRENGIILEDAASGNRSITRVAVTDTFAPGDAYDLVMVLMRKNQLDAVLPVLGANHTTPSILVMVNNAEGSDRQAEAIGRERLLLGFPGAGGTREGGVVRSFMVEGEWAPTAIGELSGEITPRLRAIEGAFKAAGLPVTLWRDMPAWLKTHVALVSPIANAIYMAGGDIRALAADRSKMALMIRAMREGFRVLRRLGIPRLPRKLVLMITFIPSPIIISVLRKGFATERARMNMEGHANAAVDEMATLAAEFKALVDRAGIPTPAIDELRSHIPPQ